MRVSSTVLPLGAPLLVKALATSCEAPVLPSAVPVITVGTMPSIIVVEKTVTSTVTATTTTASPYPFLSDTVYPGYEELPSDVDAFTAYQKTLGSTENTTLVWWYEGLSSVIPEGLPETPGLKSQTMQAWRVQHLGKDKIRADWSELIILGDFQSGDDATTFYNAQSGDTAKVPNYYYDGPVTYYISRNGTSGIALEVIQPGANITKATITPKVYNGRVEFTQVEEKFRTTALVSTLNFIASLDDIRNPDVKCAPAAGYYHAAFEGAISSIFGYPNGTKGETHILGTIHKAAVDEPLYPAQFEKFTKRVPEFFKDGKVDPDWDGILGAAGIPL